MCKKVTNTPVMDSAEGLTESWNCDTLSSPFCMAIINHGHDAACGVMLRFGGPRIELASMDMVSA